MSTFIRTAQRLFLALSMCWLCAYATPARAQDASLTSAVKIYLECVKASDFICLLDRTHPALFKMVPKEALLEKLKEQESDPDVRTRIEDLKMTKIGDVIEHQGGRYARVGYSLRTVLTMTDETNEDGTPLTEQDKKDADEITLEIFQTTYGKNNVKYDAAKREFSLQQSESMYAIREPGASDWTFSKVGTEKLLEGSVPESVLDRLKK